MDVVVVIVNGGKWQEEINNGEKSFHIACDPHITILLLLGFVSSNG